jgi:hypothetical protein
VVVKLVASMIVRNEADRYLLPNLDHLLAFCDEIRVLDDASEEPYLHYDERVAVLRNSAPLFFAHEGRARQGLLDWTMQGNPTHILAIDADEFVADGQALRAQMEEGGGTGVWKLKMTEVWGADEDVLKIRWDGDWKPRPIGIAYAVPDDWWANRQTRRHWRMNDLALACGRTPLYITMVGNRTTTDPVTEILHFGWAREAERDARYQRYVKHDGGMFHKNRHLESIMWGDDRVETRAMGWPPALDRAAILARVMR